MNAPRWALIGATGVTGRLVLERAVAQGLLPTLIGRDAAKLEELAAPHHLPTARADATDKVSLAAAVSGHQLVLNAAGPFVRTARPAIDAALETGADYLDLNGEIGPLTALYNRSAEAKGRGVALIGGVGFGIAAADALLAGLAAHLGGLDYVRIAVDAASAYATPAVAESTLAVLETGGKVLQDGALTASRIAANRWTERTPDGRTKAFASAPLAELAAAQFGYGVCDGVAGIPMPPLQARFTSLLSPLLPTMLRLSPVRRAMANTGGHAGAAPDLTLFSRVWVTARREGRMAHGELRCGEGFAAAADLAVLAVKRALADRPRPGAWTPAKAFSDDWISQLPSFETTFSATTHG